MTQTVLGWSALFASVLGSPIEGLKNFFLFHPSEVIDATPMQHGLDYEDVRFGGDDGDLLHGWYIPGQGDVIFIWFHGNGGNIRNRLEHVRLMHDHVGGTHLLFDYQGYGLSHGQPSIPGIVADGRAALQLVQERGWAHQKTVVFFGESLGCAVVIALATDNDGRAGQAAHSYAPRPDCLILEAPFYSLQAMGQLVLPPLAFLVKDDLNSARLISQLQAPLLVIHGTRDNTVPFQQGRDLYELAPSPKQLYVVPNGGHVGLYEVDGHTYFETIREFVVNLQRSASDN